MATLIAISAVIFAGNDDNAADLALGPDAAGRQAALRGVQTFTFKNDVGQPAGRKQATADLVIVDPSGWLADLESDPEAHVSLLQHKADGQPRLLLGALSLADGRSLARGFEPGVGPSALGLPSYRDPARRQTLFGRNDASLDRLLSSGFDGVVIEGAEIYAAARAEGANADAEMVDFIRELAAYARARSPSFLVLLENAEELVLHRRLLGEIDGVVKTDLLYGVAGPEERNGKADVAASLLYLKTVAASGRPVFLVETLESATKQADVLERSKSLGFRAFISGKASLKTMPRALN